MMTRKSEGYSAAVYPFTRDFVPFMGLDLCHNGVDIHVCELAPPKGFGLEGKDVGHVDNRAVHGRVLASGLFTALDHCDALFLVEGSYNDSIRDTLVETTEQAIALGKHVLCGVRLKSKEMELLQKKCEEKGVDFVYIPRASSDFFRGKPLRMYRPSASVIFVGEIVEGVNGTDVALALVDHFRRKGYRTSAILTSDCAGVVGAHSHREYGAENCAEDQKIEAMNYVIKHIDTVEVPDVIVLQLPGGMMALNDVATSHFGVHAYMWSQAVAPDYFVLCAPSQVLKSAGYDNLDRLFLYRYGYKIDCIHLSNAILDMRNLMTYFKFSFGFLPVADVLRYIEEEAESVTIPTVCALTPHGREDICMAAEKALGILGNASAL